MSNPRPGQAVASVPSGTLVLGPRPARMVCPNCHMEIITKIVYENTTTTHVVALVLCILGCIPCMFIPYCIKSCKNNNHYCPNCNTFLGTHSTK